MGEQKRKIPQSDAYGTKNARAFDARGNVRPADARYLGDNDGDVPGETLTEIRAAELEGDLERAAELASEASTPPPADPDPAHPYAGLTYLELQQAAKARDLSAGGSADEIRARLVEADKAGA